MRRVDAKEKEGEDVKKIEKGNDDVVLQAVFEPRWV